jgi:chemotaxis protein histidine kinase CheA
MISFRNMVSRVFRLTMAAYAGRCRDSADYFDDFLDEAMTALKGGAVPDEINRMNIFLEKDADLVSESSSSSGGGGGGGSGSIRLVIHETTEDAKEPNVVVEKVEEGGGECLESVEFHDDNETEGDDDDGECVIEIDPAAEAKAAEAKAAAEATANAMAAAEATANAMAAAEATANAMAAAEATANAMAAAEATANAMAAAEATANAMAATEEEEAEEEEEEAEEEAEEEEAGMEPIKIGKNMYFIDRSTNHVFAYVSEEEAGEYVGKVENGKLIKK